MDQRGRRDAVRRPRFRVPASPHAGALRENPLSKSIVEGKFAPEDMIVIDARGGAFTFEKSKTTERMAA